GVGYRYLPGADHLVTTDQAGDRTVADGDEEILAGHCRQVENARDGVGQINAIGVDVHALRRKRTRLAMHAWRLAKQHTHGQVDGHVVEMGILQLDDIFPGRLYHHRERAALTRTQRLELRQVLGTDRQ